jgi:hypothetical protein
MKTLEYRGTSHYREIDGPTFESIGLNGNHPIQIARFDLPLEQNNNRWEYFVDVTDDQAEWLMNYEKGDWAEVDKEELATVEELEVDSTLAAGAPDEGDLPSQLPDDDPEGQG